MARHKIKRQKRESSSSRKSWEEKLKNDKNSGVFDTPRGKMLIARPLDVDALIRKIPLGKVATTSLLAEKLKRKTKADFTCPLTLGMFCRIVAEASAEQMLQGKKRVAPYWRVIKSDGTLNEKYPGGINNQKKMLSSEGHKFEKTRGGKIKVMEFENLLAWN